MYNCYKNTLNYEKIKIKVIKIKLFKKKYILLLFFMYHYVAFLIKTLYEVLLSFATYLPATVSTSLKSALSN